MSIINKLLRIQKVYIFFISFILFIIIFSTDFLRAATFKVSDIKIFSSFELNFNQNKVIDDGFRESFYNLMMMITTSGDKNKIKKVPIKEIKNMVDSFTISEEKFINNIYYANLETSFNKKKILMFLEKKNIFPSIPVKNKVLLIPILIDTKIDNVYLFDKNIFYKKWNDEKKNYQLLEYLLPSEDIEDLNKIQEMSTSIESYDFTNMIKQYDIDDYIISIIYKDDDNIKVLSKINLKDSFKVNNQRYSKIDLNKEKDFKKILENLKIIYDDHWKKNNEINTSIKLPLTVSVSSKDYRKVLELEKTFNEMDLISDFYILKFDNKDIQFKIIYNGSPKTFLSDLKKRDFDLITKNDMWKIE